MHCDASKKTITVLLCLDNQTKPGLQRLARPRPPSRTGRAMSRDLRRPLNGE